MIGLSTIGSISLGWALVAGRKRVPRPAAGNTALRTFMGMARGVRSWAFRVRTDYCKWLRLYVTNGGVSEQQNPHFSRKERARNGAPASGSITERSFHPRSKRLLMVILRRPVVLRLCAGRVGLRLRPWLSGRTSAGRRG